MSGQLLPTRFLFRFAAPCLYDAKLGSREPRELEGRFRLPSLGELASDRAAQSGRATRNQHDFVFPIDHSQFYQPSLAVR